MFSSSKKNTFMSFETFKNIIDNYSDDFELQLEGGEPLLHPDLYLFLEYARNSGRCKKVIITTNGILLMII
jgi:molybdenum cofactor biosynthesis enzyme MoaA